jgi:hypothetical protein
MSECGHAGQIAALEERVHRQAQNIREMQRVLERKNRELDALHLVWCDGGCSGGMHRWTDEIITGDLVATAERNTARLRRWYNAVKWRLEHYKAGTSTEIHEGFVFHASQWHEDYALRNAAKTDLAGPSATLAE